MRVWHHLEQYVTVHHPTFQGQEIVAESALEVASKDGHWVILQVRAMSLYGVALYIPSAFTLYYQPKVLIKLFIK